MADNRKLNPWAEEEHSATAIASVSLTGTETLFMISTTSLSGGAIPFAFEFLAFFATTKAIVDFSLAAFLDLVSLFLRSDFLLLLQPIILQPVNTQSKTIGPISRDLLWPNFKTKRLKCSS